MITSPTFSAACLLSNGQSVENLLGQLQEQCPKLLSLKNGSTIEIFDDFPDNISFEGKTNEGNFRYHNKESKYIFFKKCQNDMSLDSSERSSPIRSSSFLKKVRKIIIVDEGEELSFYHYDYPVEFVKT